MTPTRDVLLSVENLNVRFGGGPGTSVVHAVRDVSFDVRHGEVLGLVGESGSGKSALATALMGLHPSHQTHATADSWRLGDTDLTGLDAAGWRALRGRRLAMVFQDPMSALNPYLTVGAQLDEVLRTHTTFDRKHRQQRCQAALADVGLCEGHALLRSHPHTLSGGMRQRIVIAMALLGDPQLLIADEPTTALDVTVQAQILALLGRLCEERRMAMILVTHDLAVLAGIAQRVCVMYAGQWVEVADTESFYAAPAHPYSRGLLQAMPDLQAPRSQRPIPIEGTPPPLDVALPGCAYVGRCPMQLPVCAVIRPAFAPRQPAGFVRCHNPYGASDARVRS